jgi:hypothetical protein
VAAYEQAFATLKPADRELVLRGEHVLRSGDAYRTAIGPHFEAVSIYDGAKVFAQQLAKVPKPARHLLSAHWCQSEVCNGGLLQFFHNSTGVLAPEAVAGFTAIGMPRTAALVTKAMKKLGRRYPRESDARDLALQKLSETDSFDELDEAFYKHLGRESGGFAAAADAYYYRVIAKQKPPQRQRARS